MTHFIYFFYNLLDHSHDIKGWSKEIPFVHSKNVSLHVFLPVADHYGALPAPGGGSEHAPAPALLQQPKHRDV